MRHWDAPVLVVQDDAQFVPERDSACSIAFFCHGMRGSQLDADHVVALQKVMRRCCDLWGNGLSLLH